MIRTLILTSALVSLAACGGAQEEATPAPVEKTVTEAPTTPAAEAKAEDLFTVEGAWVRAPLAGSDKTGAYLTITPLTDTPASLVAANSDIAETLELHTHVMDGTTMAMRKVDFIEIPAVLKPMSNHIMLFGVDPELKEGDTATLELVILSGSETMVLTVEAPVKSFE